MGRKSLGKPSWFKLFGHHLSLMEAVPDAVAGRAVKAALVYFETGELPELEPLTMAVFCALRPQVEEAHATYKNMVEQSRRASMRRWHPQLEAGMQSGYQHICMLPEGEGEEEGEEEGEGEEEKAAPPFCPPTAEEVRSFCEDMGYTTIDAQRFVSYYAGIGWMVGKAPMTDWKAAVTAWSRSDARPAAPQKEHGLDRLARMYQEEFAN